jgi:hypothetical protein
MDFTKVDTTGISIAKFPDIAAELRKPAHDAQVPVETRMSWIVRGVQGLLIRDVRLTLKGTLRLYRDCRWAFHGSLSARFDRYDFNPGNRDLLAETLTTIGRKIPGKNYDIEFRGEKPISESGKKEPCP